MVYKRRDLTNAVSQIPSRCPTLNANLTRVTALWQGCSLEGIRHRQVFAPWGRTSNPAQREVSKSKVLGNFSRHLYQKKERILKTHGKMNHIHLPVDKPFSNNVGLHSCKQPKRLVINKWCNLCKKELRNTSRFNHNGYFWNSLVLY